MADYLINLQGIVNSLNNETRELKICFVNMWENFQPDYNFFTLLLNSALSYRKEKISVCGFGYPYAGAGKPDLVIMGPYGNQTTTIPFPGVPTVFHTAEQVPLPIDHPDIFLNLGFTHPRSEHEGRVMRLPLWMMSIDWFGADNDRLVNPKLMPLIVVVKLILRNPVINSVLSLSLIQ